MGFEGYFRIVSYATIAAAALALFVAGGIGVWLTAGFALLLIFAWKLERTRWQLSERVALVVILISLPVLYVDWRILTPFLSELTAANGPARGGVEVAVLAHLILFLSGVKLLQRKADRDWFFLYLISFFEVLLAAGLTASPVFLATLILYLLCVLSTVVAFEIQKARKRVTTSQTRLLVPPDSILFQKLPMRLWRRRYLETRRLPLVSIGLLVLIVVLALPFFLIAPRTASSALSRGGYGLSGFIGFSENVTLGEIGHLKGNDEIFMHVRVESSNTAPSAGLRWRGVALDEFTGKAWKKSAAAERFEKKESERGFFQVGTTEDITRLTTQTVFLEAVDTPVLFGASRIVAIQGRLPFIRIDGEGAIQTRPHDQERVVYKAYSDTIEPSANVLRSDQLQYSVGSIRYLELPPNLDPRIRSLAGNLVKLAGANNRYDAARVIEAYLRDNYGYSLDLKAGGPDPLSDFLFDVRKGHCEYFATAMAVMLRTQGIASRVVNGLVPGEYNEAAGAYTVRQSDAHSWVEVYFPQTNSWITFDPSPPAGRTARVRSGVAGILSKYSEALELIWFQHVVGYDKQEQRSLVTSLCKELFDLRRSSVTGFEQVRRSLPFLIKPIGIGLISLSTLLLIVFLTRRIRRFGWRRGLRIWPPISDVETSQIDFYERFVGLLEKQGFTRETFQTPLEFALAVGRPEALIVTAAYNRVRFGAENLSRSQSRQLEEALAKLEKGFSAQ